MDLPPLPHEETAAYLARLFARKGKSCPDELCAEIARKVGQHPYYVQRLAREVYDLDKKEYLQEDVEQALKQVIDAERYAFEATLSQLTISQVRVIRTLAGSPTREMLSGEFTGKCGLPASSVQFARERLHKEDLIEQGQDGTWKVVDPVFARWLNAIATGAHG